MKTSQTFAAMGEKAETVPSLLINKHPLLDTQTVLELFDSAKNHLQIYLLHHSKTLAHTKGERIPTLEASSFLEVLFGSLRAFYLVESITNFENDL